MVAHNERHYSSNTVLVVRRCKYLILLSKEKMALVASILRRSARPNTERKHKNVGRCSCVRKLGVASIARVKSLKRCSWGRHRSADVAGRAFRPAFFGMSPRSATGPSHEGALQLAPLPCIYVEGRARLVVNTIKVGTDRTVPSTKAPVMKTIETP